MSGPLYVPVLPTKPHAVGAFRLLWPDVRAAIRPLWNLPPLPGVAPETLVTVVGKYVDPVSAVSRHGGWIDAPFGEDVQTAALAEALAVYCELGRLRPVTGPERTTAQQAAAVETARRLPARPRCPVRVTGEWDGRLGEAVRGLLAGAGPEVPVDLLLDMGAVLDDRPDAGKEALRALDALMRWRCGAAPLCSGEAFPGSVPTCWRKGRTRSRGRSGARGTRCVPRAGPMLRCSVTGLRGAASGCPRPGSGAREEGRPALGCAPLHHRQFVRRRQDVDPGAGPDRRQPRRGPPDHRAARVPGCAGRQGEEWLSACANGPLSAGEGVGGPTEWLRAGNLQHMTFVVRSLPGG
ncbi:hypothetical protein GCM10023238_11600 [Streptomyces heliomycini]